MARCCLLYGTAFFAVKTFDERMVIWSDQFNAFLIPTDFSWIIFINFLPFWNCTFKNAESCRKESGLGTFNLLVISRNVSLWTRDRLGNIAGNSVNLLPRDSCIAVSKKNAAACYFALLLFPHHLQSLPQRPLFRIPKIKIKKSAFQKFLIKILNVKSTQVVVFTLPNRRQFQFFC